MKRILLIFVYVLYCVSHSAQVALPEMEPGLQIAFRNYVSRYHRIPMSGAVFLADLKRTIPLYTPIYGSSYQRLFDELEGKSVSFSYQDSIMTISVDSCDYIWNIGNEVSSAMCRTGVDVIGCDSLWFDDEKRLSDAYATFCLQFVGDVNFIQQFEVKYPSLEVGLERCCVTFYGDGRIQTESGMDEGLLQKMSEFWHAQLDSYCFQYVVVETWAPSGKEFGARSVGTLMTMDGVFNDEFLLALSQNDYFKTHGEYTTQLSDLFNYYGLDHVVDTTSLSLKVLQDGALGVYKDSELVLKSKAHENILYSYPDSCCPNEDVDSYIVFFEQNDKPCYNYKLARQIGNLVRTFGYHGWGRFNLNRKDFFVLDSIDQSLPSEAMLNEVWTLLYNAGYDVVVCPF